ncbi:dihydrofolate reductase [Castellaniella sp.]|uniref:dihydrofolate reductase n=1 Tax=Castellaniella sp. TaxID=1955812 RepID=UPI00356B0138
MPLAHESPPQRPRRAEERPGTGPRQSGPFMNVRQHPHIRLVVAYDQNRAIGFKGGMPWHLPGDLAHFKRVTLGHPIIMGRKTWLSLGRPLPGRRNLVLSRDPDFCAPGAQCCASLDEALAQCANDTQVAIIGGQGVFELALPIADEIIATEIHASYPADTWFPRLPDGIWKETGRQSQRPESGVHYDFVIYHRG